VLNIAMLGGVAYYDVFTQGNSVQRDTLFAAGFCLLWLIVGFGYLFIRKTVKGVAIFHSEDHKEKLEAAALAATGD